MQSGSEQASTAEGSLLSRQAACRDGRPGEQFALLLGVGLEQGFEIGEGGVGGVAGLF